VAAPLEEGVGLSEADDSNGVEPVRMHAMRVRQTLKEAKPKAGSFSRRAKRSFGSGPQTGVEAQKPTVHIIPDLPLDCLLSFSFRER
jgi:hypothetical protein